MNDVVKTAWAAAKANGDFVSVETYSGYRSCRHDPQGKQHLLKPEVGDQELGEAVLDALAHSRFVLPQEDKALYDYKQAAERYAAWVEHLQSVYGYKTKRALFKDMKSCSIQLRDGMITISPTYHEKLEGWSGDGISHEDHVVIAADRPADEIGAALRLAFSRCKG